MTVSVTLGTVPGTAQGGGATTPRAELRLRTFAAVPTTEEIIVTTENQIISICDEKSGYLQEGQITLDWNNC